MPQFINHRTGELITVMAHSGDYVHQSNTGNEELDQEDVLNINKPNWNNLTLGLNKADPIAKVEGAKDFDRNARGKINALYRQRQKEDYFELKGGD
jgi:hypothetical protein